MTDVEDFLRVITRSKSAFIIRFVLFNKNSIPREIFFIRSYGADNEWKFLIGVRLLDRSGDLSICLVQKKTLSKPLSRVKISASSVGYWWRYLKEGGHFDHKMALIENQPCNHSYIMFYTSLSSLTLFPTQTNHSGILSAIISLPTQYQCISIMGEWVLLLW